MRDALTGQNGEAGFAGSGGSDMDRLMKLKKAVDSIERRIAAQSARPPYAAPTMPAGDIANMQQQLNMISQQIAQSQQYPPAYAAPPMAPPAPAYGNHDPGAAAQMIKKSSQLT